MLDFLLGRITFDGALKQSWEQQAVLNGKAACGKANLKWIYRNVGRTDERLNWLDSTTK
jgi:hypothetical protein